MNAIFCIYLIILILRPQEVFPSLQNLPIAGAMLAVFVLAWLFYRTKQLALPQVLLTALFVAWAGLTVGLGGWWGGVPAALVSIAVPASLIVMASSGAHDPRSLTRAMRVLVVGALVLVAYVVIQTTTGVGPVTGLPYVANRPYYVGIFNDPNDLGVLFLVALAFTITLFGRARGAPGRWWNGVASMALLYGIVCTNSRGDLLAALLLIALVVRRRFGTVLSVLMAAAGLAALVANTRMSELNSSEVSANNRINLWYDGINMLREHPVFGVGFGNFANHAPQTAHNSIVLAMAELGLPGLMLWIGILWYSVRMLRWVVQDGLEAAAAAEATSALREQALERSELASGVLRAFMAVGLASFFLSNTYKFSIFMLCGLAMGLYTHASMQRTDAPTFRILPDLGRLLIVSLSAIVAVYVAMKLNI